MNTDFENNYEFDDYLDEIGLAEFGNAVVTGTDWTTETIIRQVEKGNISLSPIFQRRDAWTKERKSLFIESLLIGMPIPQLVLAEDPHERGRFIVLDGKQRLLSILQFAAVDSRDIYPALRLKHLPLLNELEGKIYEDLVEDRYNLSNFENQWIRTVIIKNCPSEKMLSQVFYRLNTGSLPLSPQELRFALYPGEFTSYIDEKSENSEALRYFLGNTTTDFRMRDVELMLRLFTNFDRISTYRGNLKDFLDQGFKYFSDNFNSLIGTMDEHCQKIDEAHGLIMSIFGDDSYSKWNGEAFESRKNRAIFEILIYVFSDDAIRQKISAITPEDFKAMFIELCESNQSFVNSLEKTTKSVSSVTTRFNVLIDTINSRFGTSIDNIELNRG
ncbi:DUF262 domain-containing protein [Vibrio sp. RC27]